MVSFSKGGIKDTSSPVKAVSVSAVAFTGILIPSANVKEIHSVTIRLFILLPPYMRRVVMIKNFFHFNLMDVTIMRWHLIANFDYDLMCPPCRHMPCHY